MKSSVCAKSAQLRARAKLRLKPTKSRCVSSRFPKRMLRRLRSRSPEKKRLRFRYRSHIGSNRGPNALANRRECHIEVRRLLLMRDHASLCRVIAVAARKAEREIDRFPHWDAGRRVHQHATG